MNLSDETQLGRDLRRLVEDQPFRPDIEAIGLRARKRRQRVIAVRGAVSAAAAVVIAGGALAVAHGSGGAPAGAQAGGAPAAQPSAGTRAPAANAALMSLAARVTASSVSQPGDASLVFQTQTIGGKRQPPEYYVYTDKGGIYGGQSKSELQAEVARHDVFNDGGVAQEVAAARYAATGDLATARIRVVDATGGSDLGLGLPPAERQKAWDKGLAASAESVKLLREKGIKAKISATPPTGKALDETVANLIWTGTTEALPEAGGNPEVKAGVLRLLATVPGVTVTKSVTGGKATLTLTAGPAVFRGDAHHEVLVIDAATGAPMSLLSADKDGLSATETYQVSRVTLSDVAKGRF